MSHPQTTAKEVAHEFFEGIDARDPSMFDDLVADDVTTGIYRAGEGDDVTGLDGMKELWDEYWNAFPDLSGESTTYVQEGDRVAIFRREVGTHEGDFRGIAPTGTSITFEYSGYLDIDNEQIVHAFFHGDMLNLLQQLGVESPFPAHESM